jgi:hypothetical protein
LRKNVTAAAAAAMRRRCGIPMRCDVAWAHWLRKTIPSAVALVEIPGAKLFFAEDRPEALVQPLRCFWQGRGA